MQRRVAEAGVPQMEQVNVETQGGKPVTKLKAVVGPLTLRDVIVIAGAVLVLVGSLIPIPWTKSANVNLWIFPGLPFQLFVSLLLPLGVGAAFTWRRLTGRTRVRVGSLSLDQFGSVTGLISGAFFFNSYAATMSPAYLLGLLGSFAMIFGTTLARYFEFMRRDFLPGNASVITEDVYPVAGTTLNSSTTANSSTSTQSAPAGDADEVFGARQSPDGPRPVPQAPRETGVPVAPAASSEPVAQAAPSGAGIAHAASSDDPHKGSDLEASTDQSNESSGFEKNMSPALASSEEANNAVAVDKPETLETPEDNEQDFPAQKPVTEASGPEESSAESIDNSVPSVEKPVEDTAESKDAQSAAADVAEKKSEDVVAESAALDQSAAQHSSNSTAAANPPETSAEAADKSSDSANETSLVTDQAEKPSSSTESAKTEFPAATLGQDEAEESENSIAGSGLSPAAATPHLAEAKPAQQSTVQAPAPADATAAIPAAKPTPNATAALSRTEIAAQMAQAASHKEASETTFGARADLESAEPEPKSFWFALNQAREVFDPRKGTRITTLQPGVWILCLEDRGQDYLISLDGGRKAVLRDLDNLQFPEN